MITGGLWRHVTADAPDEDGDDGDCDDVEDHGCDCLLRRMMMMMMMMMVMMMMVMTRETRMLSASWSSPRAQAWERRAEYQTKGLDAMFLVEIRRIFDTKYVMMVMMVVMMMMMMMMMLMVMMMMMMGMAVMSKAHAGHATSFAADSARCP
jgi:magnesium-transporting ATPase (P-type)